MPPRGTAKKPAAKKSAARKPAAKTPAAKTPAAKTPAAKKKKTTVAVRTDPELWGRVKRKWMRGSKGGPAGKWNARKAMLAVREYKEKGGGYVGPRREDNSLRVWQKEDWGYIDGNPKGRYLPARVRESLTPAEKRRENRLKGGQKGKNVSWSPSVAAKVRRAGVGEPRKPADKKVATRTAAAKKK